MNEPVLVIMAAGMGSRYGGLKQIDPVDQNGHIIMDFSLYDALQAGFKKAIIVIKKADEIAFKDVIGSRLSSQMEICYVYQELDDLPEGYQIPSGRVKPWGTAHVLYCCRDLIDGPFAVINADDYYGRESFKLIYNHLVNMESDYDYAMVGYQIENTLTENGTVARGICEVDDSGKLINVVERTKIKKAANGAMYTENDIDWLDIAKGTTVSMNLWGFSKSIIEEIANGFETFLKQGLADNPLKCEYFIPSVVSRLLENKQATVKVLKTSAKWYGVTYKEDKPVVVEAIARMKDNGKYPQDLWGDLDE